MAIVRKKAHAHLWLYMQYAVDQSRRFQASETTVDSFLKQGMFVIEKKVGFG